MSQKSAIEKQPIIAKAAIHEGDTGSPEVQVALLTARINHLTEHLKTNKNDNTAVVVCSRWSAAAVTCWPICRRRTSTVTVL